MIIAVGNQKGGVGKSNLVTNLGYRLSNAGYQVLIIDLDTQGHQAICLGMEKAPDLTKWLGHGEPIHRVATPTGRPNLDVIRSDSSTADLKTTLAGRRFSEFILTRALAAPNRYDYILIDCAPSMDNLLVAALMAADYLIIPARMDQLSMDGLAEILDSLSDLQQFESRCKLAAIIPTFFNKSIKESFIQLQNLAGSFGGQVWPPIPQDSKIPVSNREGLTIFEYAPSSRSASAYTQITDKLLELL